MSFDLTLKPASCIGPEQQGKNIATATHATTKVRSTNAFVGGRTLE
ncbi:hypothetical protein [Xanthomonas oryzae]|uniref:Uncharacterized protein n=1 Tax=Xanthomonas oryzae pv. oryzae (strain PXO99A) TaxID=360094 RepID=A0A0K0GPD4_XANOP|nr:hypothetical protein [Xanthomonas oryzae]ACD60799.1 hypothetical protein PXO_06044 [Xanthomonas oryzae pv. oryzae PXO99A]